MAFFRFGKGRVQDESVVLHLDFEGVGGHELSGGLALLLGGELLDPVLDSLLQSLDQDVGDSSVELIDPNLEVGEALNFEDINDFLSLLDLVGQRVLVELASPEFLQVLVDERDLLDDVIDGLLELCDGLSEVFGVLVDVGVGFPLDLKTSGDLLLGLDTNFCHQLGKLRDDSALSALERPETLLEAHCNRVKILNILRSQLDRERHLGEVSGGLRLLEVSRRHFRLHNLELIQFLRQIEQHHVEVEVEVESVDPLLDVEHEFVLLDGSVDITDLGLPSGEVVVLPLLQ